MNRTARAAVLAAVPKSDWSCKTQGAMSTMAFTFFFRDAQTLELAIDQALPELCGQAFIRIWDAGCATGAEPYTLAILLRERMSDFVFRNVRIDATDVDGTFAEKVTAGVFAEQEVKRIPAEILRKYFRPAGVALAGVARPEALRRAWPVHRGAEATPIEDSGRATHPGFFEVVPELRAKVTFAQHDLLSLRPIREGLSLVVCKNVLLHLEEHERVEVLSMFHRAMRPGAWLVMEHTQKMPEALGPLFQCVCAHARVYRRVDAPESVRKHVDGPHAPRPLGPKESVSLQKP